MGASEANAPAADASLLLISVLSDRSFVSLQPRYLNWFEIGMCPPSTEICCGSPAPEWPVMPSCRLRTS
jgi:hypothetical protein